jgi:hypothetical protein
VTRLTGPEALDHRERRGTGEEYRIQRDISLYMSLRHLAEVHISISTATTTCSYITTPYLATKLLTEVAYKPPHYGNPHHMNSE